jgi:carbamoyltransferase
VKILGVNAVYHESAAALVIDGYVVAAIEEERIIRRKHAKSAEVDNPHVLPVNAIKNCLEIAGISPEEIDYIAYSFSPHMRAKQFKVDPISIEGNWGSKRGEQIFQNCLQQVYLSIRQILGAAAASKLTWVPHHVAHAASAFFPTNWESAAILVIDGIGEDASTALAYGDSHKIKILKSLPYPHSLGFLWEKISQYLGFSEYDACKVMGLAAYGDSQVLEGSFQKLARLTQDGFFVEKSIVQYRVSNFQPLEELFGPRRLEGYPITQQQQNLAATLQMFTNEAVLRLVNLLKDLTNKKRLCMTGGVALNCATNWFIKENGPFEEVYIPSGTHDSGTAIGAALSIYHDHTFTKGIYQISPYLGPEYQISKYLKLIETSGLKACFSSNITGKVAQLIASGKIVAWFQGRMEFGPRALGNRSLLADPRNPLTREIINRKVKHREDFRPFAPSVLASKAGEWFELGRCSESLKYMLFTCPVHSCKKELIPAVLHVDGTARVQLVYPEINSKYFQLIQQFEEITGVPILLNTSFNDSEPIVCSPEDAIATFKKTAIDFLVLDDYVIERAE